MTDSSRLEALQAELHARKSIFHFAHASISLLVGMVAACTAARLFWDSELEELPLFGAAVLVAAIMLTHGVVRWALGRRELGRESLKYAELKSLRADLGIDDPNVLLPQR